LHILHNLFPHLQGGPCGVLACVQAHVLKHLLFSDPTKDLTSRLANLPFPSRWSPWDRPHSIMMSSNHTWLHHDELKLHLITSWLSY